MSSEDPADFSRRGNCPACKAQNVVLKDINGLLICDKCAAKRFSSKVRKSIQEAFENQLKQAQRDAWKRRIAIAKRAIAYYEDSKFQEALKTFREYLAILENHHAVSSGHLSPSHFDQTKEAAEILLVSGIYWDVAKVYDRMKGREADMRLALNKFYEFSVDRPHLILASEAVRRYAASDKCIHKNDFNNTHRLLRVKLAKCFIAGAVFGPVAPETAVFRLFRDRVLRPRLSGRAAVAVYYRCSPPLARALARHPAAAFGARALLLPVARLLAKILS